MDCTTPRMVMIALGERLPEPFQRVRVEGRGPGEWDEFGRGPGRRCQSCRYPPKSRSPILLGDHCDTPLKAVTAIRAGTVRRCASCTIMPTNLLTCCWCLSPHGRC